MKMTKLSLIAAMAISAAFAGGDIAPVEPAVAAPSVSSTTIEGIATAYYYSDDSVDLFDDASSKLGVGVSLNVSHKINDMFTANFTAVGYANVAGDANYFYESMWGADYHDAGAYFNVANLTATFGDTTAVLGRQLINSPMVQGYDWMFAPGAFQAYTLVNSSIENVTLVGTYLEKWRPQNGGDNWINLTSAGDNWAVGAAYSNGFTANIWYYNVDALGYTQVYVDAGTTFSGVDVAAQYVETNYDLAADSTAYGIQVSGKVSDVTLTAAYNSIQDNNAGFVEWNNLYTNSWNTTVGNQYVGTDVNAWKIDASTSFDALSAEISYADYDNNFYEFDVILGYEVSDTINVGAVYSQYENSWAVETSQLELYATYKF